MAAVVTSGGIDCLRGSVVARWLAVAGVLLLVISSGSRAAGMLDHIDMSAPAMTHSTMSRAEVVDRLEAARAIGEQADFSRAMLNGLDLSNLNFYGADFRWARLNRVDFSGSDFSGADFSLAWMVDSIFDKATLVDVLMMSTQLQRASFRDAVIRDARIVGDISGGDFFGAVLTNVDMAPDMTNQSMGLSRAILDGVRGEKVQMLRVNLERASLEFARFPDAVLRDVSLRGAEAAGVRFPGAVLERVDVARADIASADFSRARELEDFRGFAEARNRERAFMPD